MNNQEIFDTIVSHMRTQKYSCMNAGHCRYYDPKTGRKCAVGCLIPTEMYNPEMDELPQGTGILCNDLVKDALEKIGIEPSISLLSDMQVIHDGMYDSEWGMFQEEQCRDVALRYNLNYTLA